MRGSNNAKEMHCISIVNVVCLDFNKCIVKKNEIKPTLLIKAA